MNTLDDEAGLANPIREESWAQASAVIGAVAWVGIAVLARVGVAPIAGIELMFLFAPLVIVPLGMELGRMMGAGGGIYQAARKLQPVAAAVAIVALWLPPGRIAGALACAWMLVCSLMALSGLVELASGFRYSSFVRFAIALGRIDLAVGGAWFVASRLGMRPMGIQEPIGLLTAVHFHYAGFATALIAAAALRLAELRGGGRWLKWVVLIVVGMPFVVAAGFVISPVMKMVAATLFAVSVAGLAVFLRSCRKDIRNRAARWLLQVAAASVFAGMVLAAIYAIADLRGSDVLPIPQMARTHGVLNAVGFCMCALLGWVVDMSEGRGGFES